MSSMDDPREILKAAGVECAEVAEWDSICVVEELVPAILALARGWAECKADADERERIMHGKTESEYVRYLGQIGPGDVIVGGGGGGTGRSSGGTGGCVDQSPRIIHNLTAEEMDHE